MEELFKFNRLLLLFLIMAVFVIVEVLVVEKVLLDLHKAPAHHHITGVLNAHRVTNDINKMNIPSITRIKELAQILEDADVVVTDEEKKRLASVEDVEKLYGAEPKIIGLDTCEAFRNAVPIAERLMGPSGMFNSGTNLIEQTLIANCYFPERMKLYGNRSTGMRLQPPWGKHNPVTTFRGNHTALRAGRVKTENFLPIVAIKDPYTWMSSMCRHHYLAYWEYTQQLCPNLVPQGKIYDSTSESNRINPVKLVYNPTDLRKGIVQYDSLVHLWNEWYNDYLHVTFPRLIVRYEDLLFNLESTATTICHCGGGTMKDGPFIREAAAAKNEPIHAGSSGLKEAIFRYSDKNVRKYLYKQEDLNYANQYLDKNLMDVFGYNHIPAEHL